MRKNKARLLYFVFCCFHIAVPGVQAAGFSGLMSDALKKEYGNQAGLFDFSSQTGEKEPSGQGAIIDNSIDEDKYMIGMGDEFHISVIETPSISYSARVRRCSYAT